MDFFLFIQKFLKRLIADISVQRGGSFGKRSLIFLKTLKISEKAILGQKGSNIV